MSRQGFDVSVKPAPCLALIKRSNRLIDSLTSTDWQIWTGKSQLPALGALAGSQSKLPGPGSFFPRSTQTLHPPSSCCNVNPIFSCVCYGRTGPRQIRNAVTMCLQRASISTAIYLVSCHYVTRAVKHISLPGWSLGLFYERPRRRSLQPNASQHSVQKFYELLSVFSQCLTEIPLDSVHKGNIITAVISGACRTPLSLLIIWPGCKQ